MNEPVIPSLLPSLLIARILSYQIHSIADAAKLRFLNKEVVRQLLFFSKYCTTCPGRRRGTQENGSFVEQLHAVDRRRFMAGVIFKGEATSMLFRVLAIPTYTEVEIRILEDPRCLSEVKSCSFPNLSDTSEQTLANLQHICQSIERATSAQQWQEMATKAKELGIFTQPDKIKTRSGNRDNFFFPAMVTFYLSPWSQASIRKTVNYNGNTFYLFDHQDDGAVFQPICQGGQSWAVETGSERIFSVLIFLKVVPYQFKRLGQTSHCDATIDSISSRMVWLHHCQSQTRVEGVVVVDDFLSHDHKRLLEQQVTALANGDPKRIKHIVDPFFYAYDLRSYCPYDTRPRRIPAVEPSGNDEYWSSSRDRFNFWFRHYRKDFKDYVMLPSNVSVFPDGDCSFDTYIPHLGWSPSDPDYLGLYRSLSLLLKQALPCIESVYSYSYAMRRLLINDGQDKKPEANPSPLQPLNIQPISLRGRKLQIFTHIVEEAVDGEWKFFESKWKDGWHWEGMDCEEIVLTCLYILDNDDALQIGELEFRRMIASDEKPFVDRRVGMVPLGKVAACSGRLIVYPNCHVNRSLPLPERTIGVKRRVKDTIGGKRRVVMFHLVNPMRRIRSTAEDAPWNGGEGHDSHRRDAEEARQQSTDYVDPVELVHRYMEAPVHRINQWEKTQYSDDGQFWYYY